MIDFSKVDISDFEDVKPEPKNKTTAIDFSKVDISDFKDVKPKQTKTEGFAKTVADSAMFGTSPLIAGGVAEAENIAKNILRPSGTSIRDLFNPLKGYGTKFEPARKQQIKDLEEYRKENPKMAFVADLSGGMLVPGGAAKTGAKTLLNTNRLSHLLAKGAATGGIFGGLYGLGEGISKNKDKAVDLKAGTINALFGAGAGGVMGAATMPAVHYGTKVVKAGWDTIRDIYKRLDYMQMTPQEKAVTILKKYISPEKIQQALNENKPLLDILSDQEAKTIRNFAARDKNLADVLDKFIGTQRHNQIKDIESIADKISNKNPVDEIDRLAETGRKINNRYYKQFELAGDLGKKADFNDVLEEPVVKGIVKDIKKFNEFKDLPDTDFRVLENLKQALDVRAKADKNKFANSKEQADAINYRKILYKLTDKMDEALEGKYSKANRLKNLEYKADELLNEPNNWEANNRVLEKALEGQPNRIRNLYKSTVSQYIKNAAKNKRPDNVGNNLDSILSIGRIENLKTLLGENTPVLKEAEDLITRHKNYGAITGNSTTANKIQQGKQQVSDISKSGILTKILNIGDGIPGTEFGNVLTDPKALANIRRLFPYAKMPKPDVRQQPELTSLQRAYETETRNINYTETIQKAINNLPMAKNGRHYVVNQNGIAVDVPSKIDGEIKKEILLKAKTEEERQAFLYVVENIQDLFYKATEGKNHPDTHRKLGIKRIIRYFAPFKMPGNNTSFNAKFTVREFVDGRKVLSPELIEINKGKDFGLYSVSAEK